VHSVASLMINSLFVLVNNLKRASYKYVLIAQCETNSQKTSNKTQNS